MFDIVVRGTVDGGCKMCYGNMGVCMYIVLPCGSDCFLMRATAGSDPFYPNVVDLYDSGTGRWSTAQLSQARSQLLATCVGMVAIFAGGAFGSKFLRIVFVCCVRE